MVRRTASFIVSLFASTALQANVFQLVETEAKITVKHGSNEVLNYHKAEVPPPDKADPIYTRSGFIHPIKSPKGAIVTGIHPDDHYHHLGLWHAWVKCKVAEQEVDFWNLKEGTGRVRFVKTLTTTSTENEAGFVVEQAHIAYLGIAKTETIILREEFSIMARLVDGAYEIDYATRQANVSKHDLELPQYRYGGPIAYRAPAEWHTGTGDYLTALGKTRLDGHTTRAPWCAMWGTDKSTGGDASIAILCHRSNRDFPQRMRIWPPTSNNGAIFFNYVPIQETGWSIEPGGVSTMRYRLVVADKRPDNQALNARWNLYCRP